MKNRLMSLLLILVLLGCGTQLSASEWQIHTFGGGELLTNVFNMVKMILYGNSTSDLGAAFNGFSRIILMLGAVSGLIILIFKQNPSFYFKNFLAPAFLILNILLVPRTDVIIHDEAIRNSSNTQLSSTSVVRGVPFLYGTFISLLSELSHNFTKLLEHCTHQVNDSIYNWTGRIYAGEYALRIKLDSILNKDVESNFREYCRNCVWSDLERGLYSRKELMSSPDLLSFLKERTSNLNTVRYQTYDSKSGNSRSFLTCKEAINKIADSLTYKQPVKSASHFIDKYLPTAGMPVGQALKNDLSNVIDPHESDLNFLLGKSRENSLNTLKLQSGIIKILKEELPGTQTTFTAKRAEAQNRESMRTTGAIAASSLVTMKNVFEALIYFSFPLICLFALIPLMQHIILTWMKACIWLATLAPFYVIINSILTLIWSKKKSMLMGQHTDLTLYTYDGLLDLYDSMEAVAALAIGSIFTISLLLTRSGFSGFSHAFPSLFSHGQSASQSAAAEKVSGNYSFGNVSLDSASAHNYDAFRQNYSGSLTQGGVQINEPEQAITHDLSSGRSFVHQENSRLRDSLSQTQAFSQNVQNQLATTDTMVQEESVQFSDSSSAVANHAVGMMEAYSSNLQNGSHFSDSQTSGVGQTFQKLHSLAQDYSESNNCSYEQAVREMADLGLKIPLTKIGAGVNFSDGSNLSDSTSMSERYSQAESFTGLLQQASQYSSSQVGSMMENYDQKQHSDFTDSWNRTAAIGDHLRASLSKQSSLSELQSYMESDSLSIQQNLDQSFVDFLNDRYDGDMGLVNKTLNMPIQHPEKNALIKEFVSSYQPTGVELSFNSENYDSMKHEIDSRADPLRQQSTPRVSEDIELSLATVPDRLNSELGQLRHKESIPNIEEQAGQLLDQGQAIKNSVEDTGQWNKLQKVKTAQALTLGARGVASILMGFNSKNFVGNSSIHFYQEEKEE